jgi:PAS domain S-box-containing protein
VVRSLPSAVAVMDLDGTVLAWNPAAERLLGWTEDELAGRPNPAIPEESRAALAETRGAGEGRVSWLRVPAAHRDGGTVEVEVVLAPLAGADGEPRGTVALIAESAGEAADEPGAAAAVRDDAAGRTREALPPERVLPEVAGDFLERLRAGIAAGLHLGRIVPGDRLPSIRDAARAARTDHRVVSAAYRQLAGEGVVRVVNRRGVTVAPLPGAGGGALSESAEWLARVLADAWELRVKVPQVPDLVRDWTCATTLRCACVESTDDDLAALTGELGAQWGLATYPVRVEEGAPDAPARRAALAEAMRGAELAVTTAFHARAVAPVAQAMGIPLVVASMSGEVVEAVEEKLRAGPLTAVVADERWGARLRAAVGGARLRVVRADDAAAVAALDPSEPVLLTRAARERMGAARPRLLVPPTHFLSTECAGEIARVLIRRNVEAARALN